MKNGRICGVEFLTATEDDARIAEAHDLFDRRGLYHGSDGFEVWDGQRFVYRFVVQATAQPGHKTDPQQKAQGWFRRLMRGLKRGASDFDPLAGCAFPASSAA